MQWLFRCFDDLIYIIQDKRKIIILLLFYVWYLAAWKEICRFQYLPLKNNLIIGQQLVGRVTTAIDPSIPVNSPNGYDSQFYWALSIDPFLRDSTIAKSIDVAKYRSQRILLPFLTWCIIRNPSNILYGLWFWILIGITLGLIGLYRLCKHYGISPGLPMLFYLFNPGVVIATVHPMSDALASGLVLFAWSWWTRKRVWMSSIFFALACLARELSVIFILLLIFHTIFIERNNLVKKSIPLIISIIPLVIWVAHLHLGFDKGTSILGVNFDFPFMGSIKSFVSYTTHKVDIEDFISALCIHLSCIISLWLSFRHWKQEVFFLLIGFTVFISICGQFIMEDNFGSSRMTILYSVLVMMSLLMKTQSGSMNPVVTNDHIQIAN